MLCKNNIMNELSIGNVVHLNAVIHSYILSRISGKIFFSCDEKVLSSKLKLCLGELILRIDDKNIQPDHTKGISKSELNTIKKEFTEDQLQMCLFGSPTYISIYDGLMNLKKDVTNILTGKYKTFNPSQNPNSVEQFLTDVNIGLVKKIAVNLKPSVMSPIRLVAEYWLPPVEIFNLRLVCKKWTFADYNYGQHIFIVYSAFKFKNYNYDFLNKQVYMFGRQLKLFYEGNTSNLLNCKLLKYTKKIIIKTEDNEMPDTIYNIPDLELDAPNIKTMPFFPELRRLKLYATGITNFTLQQQLDYFECTHEINLKKILALRVKSVNLSSTAITDVSPLKNSRYVNLSFTENLQNVSLLKNLYTLNLENTNIEDVSMLGYVHNLNLRKTKVKNVSALCIVQCNLENCTYREHNLLHTHIHTLNLSNTKVVNVSALSLVYDLDISYTKVTDVSGLSYVHRLNLNHTPVIHIGGLSQVHTLYANGTNIDGGFSRLNYISHLDVDVNRDLSSSFFHLGRCKNLTYLSFRHKGKSIDIRKLQNPHIKYIRLYNCEVEGILAYDPPPTLLELSMIDCKLDNIYFSFSKNTGNIRIISMHNTPITESYMFNGIYNLDLSGTNVKDISKLMRVRILNISETKVMDISPLANSKVLIQLNISNLDLNNNSISKLAQCTSLREINMSHNKKITNIFAFNGIYDLDISETGVTDISGLAHIRNLIMCNTKISDLTGLSKTIRYINMSGSPVKKIPPGLSELKIVQHSTLTEENKMYPYTKFSHTGY